MSVSAIGNTYSYIYNYETKKLTTTDGTENEFTKYFNGEIDGYESETLNGFDRQRRSGFKDVLSLLEQGAFGKEKPAEDAVLELSGKNIDADTIEFYVNGKRYLKCSVAPALTYAEYEECSRIRNSGKAYACTNNDGWSYPDEVYYRVLKDYEERLNQPLSEVFDADTYRESLRSGNHSAIRESDSSDNGRAIGVTTVGNIGYVARYADSSTPENPIIKIGDYEVIVNEVDPHNATQLEMFALLSYLDDTNQTNNAEMSSFSKLRSYAELAEMNGLCEGIQAVNAFYDKNQNWEEIMRAIKEVFLGNPQTYEQALNCDRLNEVLSDDKKSGFIAEFGNYEEFHKAWMSQGAETPFSYTENKGFNEAENSISLVQRMAARLNNGFVLSITDSMVYPEGDFRDNTAAKESAAVASALSHLIKVANGQIPMNMFYSKNQDNSAYAKMGLEAFGIDTSRPFTINEKTFHYDSEGKIRLGSGE